MTSNGMDEQKDCIIYCAKNIAPNGGSKVYIGMTVKTLEERKYRHFYVSDHGGSGHFHRALRKYGRNNFLWSILDKQKTYRLALELERHFISEYRKTNELYNKTDGGGGVKGLKMSSFSRNKMSLAKLGKPNQWSNGKMPQEIRDRISNFRRTENRIITEKHRISLRINAAKANFARRKAVICLNDDQFYSSVSLAGEQYGMTSGQISYFCRTDKKNRAGLHFSYAGAER